MQTHYTITSDERAELQYLMDEGLILLKPPVGDLYKLIPDLKYNYKRIAEILGLEVNDD